MPLQESGEMYLETILVLSRQGGSVRSIDVAEEMGFSKPSVSRAIGLLKDGGYLTVDGDGSLRLSELGCQRAEQIYERHNVLAQLLVSLGVSRSTAVEDACKIEHDLSDESFAAIKRYASQLKK